MKAWTYLLLFVSIVTNIYLYSELEKKSTDKVNQISSSLMRAPAFPKKSLEKIVPDIEEVQTNSSEDEVQITTSQKEYEEVIAPRNMNSAESIWAAWDDQVYEFLLGMGVLEAGKVLDKYKALRIAEGLVVKDFFQALRQKGVIVDNVVLSPEHTVEINQISILYTERLKNLFGHEIYTEYVKLRNIFNVQIQNITREDDPLYQIDF